MVRELDAATTFNEVRSAGQRYGRLVGAQTAKILILLATAAIAQGGLIARLMKLPQAVQASATLAAETGGVTLEAVGAVKGAQVLQGGVAITVAGAAQGAAAVAMAAHGEGPGTGGGRAQKSAIPEDVVGQEEPTLTARFRRLRGKAKEAEWVSPKQGEHGPGLRDHAGKHGEQVGAKSVREYDLSARETIQNGSRFRYRDPSTNEPRIGYWNPNTGLFTATTETRGSPIILTHFPETWARLRGLPGFTLD
jgi:hypothetical protein